MRIVTLLAKECVFFSLEFGTVESHCSERGISDVTAARHTKDLQLVASSAQAHQAVICHLLEKTHKTGKFQIHRDVQTHPPGITVSFPTSKCSSYCARLHIDGSEFWAVFLEVFQCSIVQLGGKEKNKQHTVYYQG